jgi:hypothetical protein
MGRRKRRQSRAGSDPLIRHRDRIASLEHRVAGLATSEKQRQQANAIRTEIHTVLLNLKHVPRSPSREERERRNQSTSVYTVSGGLPGLGRRR